MDSLISFIPQQLLILIVALNVLGMGFKKYKKLSDKYIPIILLAFGVVFSVWMLGFNPTSVLQGILCWGVSIGLNQVCKQFRDNDK
ncbi:putative membrane protein [Clostridioides difficile CD160]|nr:putative membrane protein [Clostridioides difficile CD160]MBY2479101.1 phage holin family protein [Clostridioides difficile]